MKTYFARWVTPSDIVTYLTLGLLWFCVLLFPRKRWLQICEAFARVHQKLRKQDLHDAATCLTRAGIETSKTDLAHRMLTANYVENMETVAGFVGFRGDPDITVRGVEHINRALENGSGVILWHSPFCAAALLEKLGYRRAGMSVIHLRDRAHPYSSTKFGFATLNPIRTQIENPCLEDVVWLKPGGGRAAMTRMNEILADNKILSITAIGSGRNAIGVPLMGGTMSLARGAPSLAARTGAAVIPTAVSVHPGPRYTVAFYPPLPVDPGLSGEDYEKALVASYGEWLAARMRDTTTSWRGWIMAHTWRKNPPDSPATE